MLKKVLFSCVFFASAQAMEPESTAHPVIEVVTRPYRPTLAQLSAAVVMKDFASFDRAKIEDLEALHEKTKGHLVQAVLKQGTYNLKKLQALPSCKDQVLSKEDNSQWALPIGDEIIVYDVPTGDKYARLSNVFEYESFAKCIYWQGDCLMAYGNKKYAKWNVSTGQLEDERSFEGRILHSQYDQVEKILFVNIHESRKLYKYDVIKKRDMAVIAIDNYDFKFHWDHKLIEVVKLSGQGTDYFLDYNLQRTTPTVKLPMQINYKFFDMMQPYICNIVDPLSNNIVERFENVTAVAFCKHAKNNYVHFSFKNRVIVYDLMNKKMINEFVMIDQDIRNIWGIKYDKKNENLFYYHMITPTAIFLCCLDIVTGISTRMQTISRQSQDNVLHIIEKTFPMKKSENIPRVWEDYFSVLFDKHNQYHLNGELSNYFFSNSCEKYGVANTNSLLKHFFIYKWRTDKNCTLSELYQDIPLVKKFKLEERMLCQQAQRTIPEVLSNKWHSFLLGYLCAKRFIAQ